ncbi:RICIN domain-containing protein [Dactylosporangium sp. CS-033363]|uniref:RICIN domain-containing protein n=1 Tax=Dactylosporangium sp. CS-033363 TaxID=3239935 RepID=UPI003D943527
MIRLLRAVLAAATIAAGLLAIDAAPAAAATDVWSIYAYHRNWIIPKGGATAQSTQVVLSNPINTDVMNYWFEPGPQDSNGTYYYHIRNVASSKCLNVQGGSTANSAHVILFTCAAASAGGNDWWLPIYAKREGIDDYYLLKNMKSGKCLNIQGGSSTPGALVIQFTCDFNAQNEWFTWVRRA